MLRISTLSLLRWCLGPFKACFGRPSGKSKFPPPLRVAVATPVGKPAPLRPRRPSNPWGTPSTLAEEIESSGVKDPYASSVLENGPTIATQEMLQSSMKPLMALRVAPGSHELGPVGGLWRTERGDTLRQRKPVDYSWPGDHDETVCGQSSSPSSFRKPSPILPTGTPPPVSAHHTSKQPLPAYGALRLALDITPMKPPMKPPKPAKSRPPPIVTDHGGPRPVFSDVLVASPSEMSVSELPVYGENGSPPFNSNHRRPRKPSFSQRRYGMVQVSSFSDTSESDDDDYSIKGTISDTPSGYWPDRD
ncbi:hypothetical protein FRB99_001416 [Tulasnella sp. 403]|nr:hypothetical protein FRB99_001416 [Tulasnella sp. 403]